MRFAPNGEIIEGKNQNENIWRVTKDCLLELVQEDGSVHGRFRYDKSKKQFASTNDSDTRNVRDQYMELQG